MPQDFILGPGVCHTFINNLKTRLEYPWRFSGDTRWWDGCTMASRAAAESSWTMMRRWADRPVTDPSAKSYRWDEEPHFQRGQTAGKQLSKKDPSGLSLWKASWRGIIGMSLQQRRSEAFWDVLGGLRERILSLCSTLDPVWAQQYKTSRDKPEWGLCGATEIVGAAAQGAWGRGCGLGFYSLERRKRNFISVSSCLMGSCGGAGAWVLSEEVSGRITGNGTYFRSLLWVLQNSHVYIHFRSINIF